MKPTPILSVATAALLCAALAGGCRRQDVREMTVSMAELAEKDKSAIVNALKKYNGIDQGSYVWDMEAKTLTLRYDSMQLAQANVRYAIDALGIKVIFPAKTSDRAGH